MTRAVLLVALALAVLEGSARLAWFLFGGEAFPGRDYRARLDALAATAAGAAGELVQAEEMRRIDDPANPLALHPYSGYGRAHPARGSGYRVTPLGFYGPLAALPRRASDTLVVGLFGGSVAEEVYMVRDALSEALRATPGLAVADIEVYGFAIGGMGQPQQATLLTYLLAIGAEFDVVVSLDGFNEVALSRANQVVGLNPFDPQLWAYRVAAAVAGGSERIDALTGARARIAGVFARLPLRHSAAAAAVFTLIDNVVGRRLAAAQQRMIEHAEGASRQRTVDWHAAFDSESDTWEAFARAWARSVAMMNRLSQDSGARYVAFLQPNQYVPDSKPLSAEERRCCYRRDDLAAQAVEVAYPALRRLGGELAASGVAFHDLTMLFRDETETVYRDAICHFNKRGRIRIAEAIGAAVGAAVVSGESQREDGFPAAVGGAGFRVLDLEAMRLDDQRGAGAIVSARPDREWALRLEGWGIDARRRQPAEHCYVRVDGGKPLPCVYTDGRVDVAERFDLEAAEIGVVATVAPQRWSAGEHDVQLGLVFDDGTVRWESVPTRIDFGAGG